MLNPSCSGHRNYASAQASNGARDQTWGVTHTRLSFAWHQLSSLFPLSLVMSEHSLEQQGIPNPRKHLGTHNLGLHGHVCSAWIHVGICLAHICVCMRCNHTIHVYFRFFVC